MGLEVLFNKYLIVEMETEEYGKHMSLAHQKGGTDYGPYFFRKMAERKLEAIKKKRIEKGWEQHPVEKNHLSRGQYAVDYTIEKISNRII